MGYNLYYFEAFNAQMEMGTNESLYLLSGIGQREGACTPNSKEEHNLSEWTELWWASVC